MISDLPLSPIETARAKLQEQIANFLAGRAKLIRMMDSPSLTIKGQAQALYQSQVQLETQLQNEIMPKLQSISQGVWDVSDVLKIGGFTTMIIQQINEVGKLERQAGGVKSSFLDEQLGVFSMPALVIGGLALGFLLARR